MLVNLKKRAVTTIGPCEPGIVDLPIVDAMRLIKDGDASSVDDDEDDEAIIKMVRRNAMIKSYITR